MSLIPDEIVPGLKKSKKDFSRKRKLPISKLIVFTLSITVSGKSKGVDSKSGEFFRNARRSGLWPDAESVHRCSVSKGRNKIDWKVFEKIFYDAVDLAYELWPTEKIAPFKDSEYLWKGMSVFAIDGSKYTLPATAKIREEFDPKSGFEYKNKGHYPQCLVSTAYDVFRRFPVARTIVDANGSEREEAKELLQHIAPGNLLLFDRGYPSYELIRHINKNYSGYYIFRSPASETFPAVEEFIKSEKKESIIEIAPTQRGKAKFPKHERKKLLPIKLRVIRIVNPEGIQSVLVTNLFDNKEFSRESIVKLYFKRWAVEDHYRNEKIYLEVEKFHSRNCNGIRQELFAAMIMSVISRIIMVLPFSEKDLQGPKPQFKNAVMTIAAEAFVLTPQKPHKAVRIFREILEEIRRVKHYPPKTSQASNPRVSKKRKDKWTRYGRKKLIEA